MKTLFAFVITFIVAAVVLAHLKSIGVVAGVSFGLFLVLRLLFGAVGRATELPTDPVQRFKQEKMNAARRRRS